MKTVIRTRLPASADTVWSFLLESSTLEYITRGWVTFFPTGSLPPVWEEGQVVRTNVALFGSRKYQPYTIHFVEVNSNTLTIRTKESGGMVKTWNHTMRITPDDQSSQYCYYTDIVDIQAGMYTPLVWLYAKLYYLRRHRQWLRLIAAHT